MLAESCDISNTSKRVDVLLLLPHMVIGGSDNFVLEIVKRINKEYFNTHIIINTYYKNDDKATQTLFNYASSVYVQKGFIALEDWPGFICRFIESKAIDIVWNINSFMGYYMFPWLRMKFSTLALGCYIHADSPFWRNGGYARASVAVHEVSEITIGTNRSIVDTVIDRFDMKREQCRTSYIGVDEVSFDPEKFEYGSVRKKLGINLNRPIVLFACRMIPEKRPSLMLMIAKKLTKRIPDVCFLVVGDGPLLTNIKMESRDLGLRKNVVFYGEANDVRPFYKDANILLVCSVMEGLTQTTFEAMSMELPVISSDVGGQSEIVNDETGKLIQYIENDNKDPLIEAMEIEQYTEALYSFLNDSKLCETIGRNNRNIIKKHYTIKMAVSNFEKHSLELYTSEQLMKRRLVVHEVLNNIPHFCTEFVTTCSIYEKHEQIDKFISQPLAFNSETPWHTVFLTYTMPGKILRKIMWMIYSRFISRGV